jgi:V/A-type H+-transporting ATPase subunit I
MLRPERMSRVSVTGSKRVMDDAIETIHEMNLLHVTEYGGGWEGFSPGDPVEGADDASQRLVTVRSLQSILGVDAEDAGPTRLVTDEALETELEEVRQEVNELDDRRDDIEDDLRAVEERIDLLEPFVELGIDLDLLSGYDALAVEVGHGDPDSVRAALDDAGIDTYELFTEGPMIAVFARTDEATLADELVNADFTAVEIPAVEEDGDAIHTADAVDPEEYRSELRHTKQKLESQLSTVEGELEDLRLDVAGFLLAAEEKLAIEVQKSEAPLTFATTDNAFVAEGWIPTERFDDFVATLSDAVGDHVEIEELERAAYNSDGHPETTEPVDDGSTGSHEPTAAADGGDDERAVTDGGTVTMSEEGPPVIQKNNALAQPFEVLVKAVSRPKYSEFDPTVVLLLTFPAFFGFMIGDLGYGALYTVIGAYLYTNYESPGFKSMGGITIWSGLFTMLFGVLYGEIFGLHVLGEIIFGGHPPIEKGLDTNAWAISWLVISVMVSLVHLNLGYIFDFIENVQHHGITEALYESGSWILMLNGIWVWIFSTHVSGPKPEFIYRVFDGGVVAATAGTEHVANYPALFDVGFGGFTPTVGIAGLAVFGLGAVLLLLGEPIEIVESLNVLVNALSYTRLAAVLLAKAGMAFTVNLLFFGAYQDDAGHFHFAMGKSIAEAESGEHFASWMFQGLVHPEFAGLAGLLLGIVVLVLGHILVLALGVTSAGLQAVRLEYVEFFGKFYEGGGREYLPFGYDREYTAED